MCIPSTFSLPETKCQDNWRGTWFPAPVGAVHDGDLFVVAHPKKVKRIVSDRYEVTEHPAIGVSGRVFHIVKVDHRGDLDTVKGRESKARIGEVYETALLADGRAYCTCTGGTTRVANDASHCVHVLSLKALIEQGTLGPSPFDRYANTGEDATSTELPDDADYYPPYHDSDLPDCEPEPVGCGADDLPF